MHRPIGPAFAPGCVRSALAKAALLLGIAASAGVAYAEDPIAIRWNPGLSREEFGVLSSTTGAFTFRGVVGDLATWSGQSFLDGNTLYVTGTNSGGNNRLYVLNATTGASINAVNTGNAQSYYLGGKNAAGELIVIWYDTGSAVERFGVMNPTTGVVTPRGQVGNLATWNGQSRMAGNTMYVFGNSAGGTHNLYVVDTVGGTTTGTVNVGAGNTYFMAGLNSAGELVVIWYDTGGAVERFGVMNKTTGAVTPRGVVGDLATWSGQSMLEGNTLYAIGNGASATNLYIYSSLTGSEVDTVNVGTSYAYYLAKRQQPTWAACCDFNADGKADLLWRSQSTGENGIWFMSGGSVSSVTLFVALADVNWRIVGAADFNADNKPDILWRNTSTGSNAVWYMNGSSVTGSATLSSLADLNWHIVGAADFNADGKPDIAWRNVVTGENAFWYMNGATVTGVAFTASLTDLNWRIVAIGDFNADSRPDFVWRNSSTGQNAIWYMNNTSVIGNALTSSLADLNWVIAGAGDFNGDSKPDLVWRNYSTGQNAFWYMNGATVTGNALFTSLADLSWRIVPSDY
jgi:hypothetical protein